MDFIKPKKFNTAAYQAEYAKSHLAERKNYFRSRYFEKRDEIVKKSKEYRSKNRDKLKILRAEYRQRNREKISKAAAAAYALNPEKFRDRNSAYRRRHPEQNKSTYDKRRAVKLGATVGNVLLISNWEKSWKSKKACICFWCRKKTPSESCHSDHITPLARGGAHSIENLCISCSTCNSRKHAKSLSVWNSQLSMPVFF